ncbi:MAG: heparan-alpha-glucosaminide N-acetyltransferase domain-containing protein, partial [Mucilaginibacter sp.]
MTSFTVQPKQRIDSIDILRGLIMVIMALDHTRDFFMVEQFDPTDLSKASTGLFLTRFITHFCAPTFVFFSGTGAFLSFSRGKTKKEASVFLLTRGLWLILLELTVIGFGWSFELDYHFFFLQVIWALGVSMIALSVLIYLPVSLIAAIGLIMIFGHNMLDSVSPAEFSGGDKIFFQFLHIQGIVDFSKNLHVFVLYPLIPWIGVMATGYSFGTLFKLDKAKRTKIFLGIGVAAIVLFVIIRAINNYGDNRPWSDQGSLGRTILSFINVQKY